MSLKEETARLGPSGFDAESSGPELVQAVEHNLHLNPHSSASVAESCKLPRDVPAENAS